MQNPYEPPKAPLAIASKIELKRLNIWLMIGLMIITLGLYMPYWIHTRTRTLNRVMGDHAVSPLFATFVAGFFVVTYGLEIGGDLLGAPPNVTRAFALLSLASNISCPIWALMFRRALNRYTKANKGDSLWSNGICAWFLQVVYHQYKINRILSAQNAENLEPAPAVVG